MNASELIKQFREQRFAAVEVQNFDRAMAFREAMDMAKGLTAPSPAAEWEERWKELRQYVGIAISVRAIANKMESLAPAAEEPKPARPAMLLATFCAKGNNWLWLMRTGNKQRPWTSARDISYAPIDIVAIDEQLSDPAAVALYKSELAEAAT